MQQNYGRHSSVTSLIIPSFNPGSLVERTWAEVARFLQDAPGRWEVLFVCDGSTDNSPEQLAALAVDAGNQVQVIRYGPNRGKGFAVRQGLLAARGDWRLFTDFDLAYGFDDVLKVARALWFGADVAIASRTQPESRVVVPAPLLGYAHRRHLFSKAFSMMARLLLPLTQRDTQAGLKGMTADAVDLVLPELSCDGFGFDCELLLVASHFGLSIREIPVTVRYEEAFSTVGWVPAARMLRELWTIRRVRRRIAKSLPPTARPERKAA